MLPDYLFPENTVRECGESPVLKLDADASGGILLTLGIIHSLAQESLDVDIYESSEDTFRDPRPVANFRNKSYCGTYQLMLPGARLLYLKAVWRVSRWSRDENRPFFRFYIAAQQAPARAAAGAG